MFTITITCGDNGYIFDLKKTRYAMQYIIYKGIRYQVLGKPSKGKQADNGLQSRSSENGKTVVWHYGLKLQ